MLSPLLNSERSLRVHARPLLPHLPQLNHKGFFPQLPWAELQHGLPAQQEPLGLERLPLGSGAEAPFSVLWTMCSYSLSVQSSWEAAAVRGGQS